MIGNLHSHSSVMYCTYMICDICNNLGFMSILLKVFF